MGTTTPSKRRRPSLKHILTAVIYDRKGRILSKGENDYCKSHPRQANYAIKVGMPQKIFLHAEIDAIIKCKHIDRAYKIFIGRFGKDGRPLPAGPCPICIEAIKNTPIVVIEHT